MRLFSSSPPFPAISEANCWVLAQQSISKARLPFQKNKAGQCEVGGYCHAFMATTVNKSQSRIRHGLCLQAIHKGEMGSNIDKATHEEEAEGSTSSGAPLNWMQEMVQFMDSSKDFYPIVRTYRNNLCMLQLCGSAKSSEVLSAMASDTSYTAATDLLMRKPLTVLETVLPGSSVGSSTISTKLFAPSSLVLESAKTLAMPSGAASKGVRHKLFKAVQMLHLWKFYIEFYAPGTKRDMNALAAEGKNQAVSILEFSVREVLDELARAVALYAIACIEENNINGKLNLPSWSYISKMWQREQWFPSSHAAVRIRTLSASELSAEAKNLLGSSQLRVMAIADKTVVHECWWPAPGPFKNFIKKSLGKSWEQWAYEYLPAHRLEININLLGVKDGAGQKVSHEAHELLLSHAQLMDLASLLDLYYEDIFTLPDKKLNTRILLHFNKFHRSKIGQIGKAVSLIILVLGVAIFASLVIARLKQKVMPVGQLKSNSFTSVDSSTKKHKQLDPILPINQSVSASKMENLCQLVVAKVQKTFNWHGEIHSSAEKGAWMEHGLFLSEHAKVEGRIEELIPDTILQESDAQVSPHWKSSEEPKVKEAAVNLVGENGGSTNLSDQAGNGIQLTDSLSKMRKAEAVSKDALLYQVVLSLDGDVMGFQPLNEAAVMHWAQMPFAQELHRSRKLCSGFLEQKMKFRGPPTNAIVIELFIQMDSTSPFISAAPVHM